MRRLLWPLVCALATPACADDAPILIARGDKDALGVLEIGPSGIVRTSWSFSETVSVSDLSSSTTRLIVVGIDRAEVASEVPDFDPARFEALQFGDASPCLGQLDDEATTRSARLPDTTQVRAYELSTATWTDVAPTTESLKDLTLAVPVISKDCTPPGVMRTFLDTAETLPEMPVIDGRPRASNFRRFTDGVRVDDDSVIALSAYAVFHITRKPEAIAGLTFGGGASLRAIEIDPNPALPRRVAVVGIVVRNSVGRATLWQLLLTAQGLEITSSHEFDDPAPLRDVLFDDGRWVAIAEKGLVAVQTSSASFDAHQIEVAEGTEAEGYNLTQIVASGGDPPHLIVEDGRFAALYRGDAFTGTWSGAAIPSPVGADVIKIHEASMLRGELFASASDGLLFRGPPNEPLSVVTFEPLGSIRECFRPSRAACDADTLLSRGHGMAVLPGAEADDDRVIVTSDECTSLLFVRPSDACVRALRIDDATPDFKGEDDDPTARAFHRSGEWLTLFSTNSQVFEMRVD